MHGTSSVIYCNGGWILLLSCSACAEPSVLQEVVVLINVFANEYTTVHVTQLKVGLYEENKLQIMAYSYFTQNDSACFLQVKMRSLFRK